MKNSLTKVLSVYNKTEVDLDIERENHVSGRETSSLSHRKTTIRDNKQLCTRAALR